MKVANSLVPFVLLTALGAFSTTAVAQDASPVEAEAEAEAPAAAADAPAADSGAPAADAQGLTRSGTGTRVDSGPQGAAASTTQGLTRSGTGTLASGASAWSLEAQSASIPSPGTNTITVILPADASGASGASGSYAVALSSSDSACTVPGSVALPWTAASGGSVNVTVTCSAVPEDRNVTIAGGTATAGFVLQAVQASPAN
jgi:hypothetical protein